MENKKLFDLIKLKKFKELYDILLNDKDNEIDINIRLDEDLPPGMIFLPFCFRESAANILTNSELDPIGKIPELKFSAARIYQD